DRCQYDPSSLLSRALVRSVPSPLPAAGIPSDGSAHWKKHRLWQQHVAHQVRGWDAEPPPAHVDQHHGCPAAVVPRADGHRLRAPAAIGRRRELITEPHRDRSSLVYSRRNEGHCYGDDGDRVSPAVERGNHRGQVGVH
ncbi:unnamed protein product, partial [Ectocarpus sp. 12 AP-2014]